MGQGDTYFDDDVLWMQKDNEPAAPLVNLPGRFATQMVNGVTISTIEYDNVPADLADNPQSVYRFAVGASDWMASSNVWVHAVVAEQAPLQPVQPQGTGSPTASHPYYAPRLQDVQVHPASDGSDGLQADVTLDLFVRDTLLAAPAGFAIVPSLFQNGALLLREWVGVDVPEETTSRWEQTAYTDGGEQYARWVDRNVPLDPTEPTTLGADLTYGNQVFGYTNFWTYAPNGDIRTQMPDPPVPPACVPVTAGASG